MAPFLRALTALHIALVVLGAIGFFVFWARTRFWLPKYVHVLAVIALAVSVWSISISAPDSPVGSAGPSAKALFALVLPAIVYFFFVFYGGQHVAFSRRTRSLPKCPSCGASVIARLSNDREGSQFSSGEPARCGSCGQAVV